jgi:hypothetical protein
MEKKIQELVASNIGDESLWYVCYIYSNLPANQKLTETATHHVVTYIHGEPEKIS